VKELLAALTLARFRRSLVFAGGVAAVAALSLGAANAGGAEGAQPSASFDTAKPPQLVPLEDGVQVDPIITTGDVVGDYQMSGIPDGLGAYRGGPKGQKLIVLMNHELDGTPPDSPEGVGARVSRLTLDPQTKEVLKAAYPIDGTEGFLRFCSATLARIDGEPMYFTGEESTRDGALTDDPADGLGRGGSSIALDARTGDFRETEHFGFLRHENVVPAKGLERAVFLTTEDGAAQRTDTQDANPEVNESQLYAYIAPTFGEAISGRKGSLYVWKADESSLQATDGDPSTNDIEQGETIQGSFVPVSQEENADADALEAAAQSKGAFDFVRLEDAAKNRIESGRYYIADTGALDSESARGRIYRLDINRKDPTKASLTLEIDGDTSTDPVKMTNPDNMDTSEQSLVIQENRISEFRAEDYSRVLVYDLASKELRAVARVDTPQALTPGTWEPSGVINATGLLGEDRWLLDVQAHSTSAPQPGPSLEPNSSSGEDGQLLEIAIPDS
jgi:hypothetical protein